VNYRIGIRLAAMGAAWWTGSACSAVQDTKAAADTAAGAESAASATSDVALDSGATAPSGPVARWFSLDGQLSVRDGNVELESSLFTLGFWGESNLEPSLYCSLAASISASAVEDPPPEPALLGWWDLTLSDDGSCPSNPGPLSLALGIGPYDSLLDPAMDQQGLSLGSWNGAYLRLDGLEDLWIFGVIGTAGQADGTAPALRRRPVPDGDYLLTTLHLLPL
jgi:hypothetical protein